MLSLFDVQKLSLEDLEEISPQLDEDELGYRFRISLILHENGKLEQSPLDFEDVKDYAVELLSMNSKEFWKYVSDNISDEIQIDIKVISPLLYFYAFIAARSNYKSLRFQYDPSYYKFINKLQGHKVSEAIHCLYNLDVEMRDNDPLLIPLYDVYIKSAYNTIASIFSESIKDGIDFLKSPFGIRRINAGYMLARLYMLALKHDNIKLTEQLLNGFNNNWFMLWICTLDPNQDIIDVVNKRVNFMFDLVIDHITLSILGRYPGLQLSEIYLNDLIEGILKETELTCDNILKFSREMEFIPEQTALLIKTLMKYCPEDFSLNKLSKKISSFNLRGIEQK